MSIRFIASRRHISSIGSEMRDYCPIKDCRHSFSLKLGHFSVFPNLHHPKKTKWQWLKFPTPFSFSKMGDKKYDNRNLSYRNNSIMNACTGNWVFLQRSRRWMSLSARASHLNQGGGRGLSSRHLQTHGRSTLGLLERYLVFVFDCIFLPLCRNRFRRRLNRTGHSREPVASNNCPALCDGALPVSRDWMLPYPGRRHRAIP